MPTPARNQQKRCRVSEGDSCCAAPNIPTQTEASITLIQIQATVQAFLPILQPSPEHHPSPVLHPRQRNRPEEADAHVSPCREEGEHSH